MTHTQYLAERKETEKKQNIQVKKRRKIDKSRVENPDRLFDLRKIKKNKVKNKKMLYNIF